MRGGMDFSRFIGHNLGIELRLAGGEMRQKMSMFESIRQGLQEAIDFAEGKPVKAVSPPDVKAVREHVGMKGNLLALRGNGD